MMRVLTFLLLCTLTRGFSPLLVVSNPSTTTTELRMGMLDNLFKPIHGHGSAEKDLDSVFRAEQELLKERQEHYRKDQLKKKYKSSKNWMDRLFQPFHAHGSAMDGGSPGEDRFDEMMRAQQQMLYERREYYGNKDQLKKKYQKSQKHLQDIPVHKFDPKVLNQKEDDAMWIDEKGFEFPSFFGKSNKKLKP